MVPPEAALWELRRVDLLGELSDRDLDELGRMAAAASISRGRSVYSEGDPSDRVFMLQSGTVKVSRRAAGRRITIDLLRAGDLFGELALAGEAQRRESVTAVEDAVVYAIEADRLEQFLRCRPGFALRVAKLLGERMQRVGTKLEELLFRGVRSRLAMTLARLAREFGDDGDDGVRIGLRLTQTELAHLIGSTRETTSSAFNELRREGLVDTRERHLLVLDVPALERL